MDIKIIDKVLRKVLEDKQARQFDYVYELSDDSKYKKLVFSIHGLNVELDEEEITTIAHTKFIFRTDLEEKNITENYFWYLKEINCVYNKIDFESAEDLELKLKTIITEDKFGTNLRSISNFIADAPASHMNDYLSKRDISTFTITNVSYNPKLKMFPCEETSFDFDIDINNGQYEIKLSIKKSESEFSFFYYIIDEVIEKTNSDLNQMPQLITDHIISIYQENLS